MNLKKTFLNWELKRGVQSISPVCVELEGRLSAEMLHDDTGLTVAHVTGKDGHL